jgi:hypothetical protein
LSTGWALHGMNGRDDGKQPKLVIIQFGIIEQGKGG